MEKTTPPNQITFIFHCGFYQVICHEKTKEQIKPCSLLNVRFSLFVIEAFPQKCNTRLDGIHHPFILRNLHHVFSRHPFLLSHM